MNMNVGPIAAVSQVYNGWVVSIYRPEGSTVVGGAAR